MTVPLPPGSVPAGPVVPYSGGPVLVTPELVPDRQGVMACLSSTTRNGGWVLPRLFRALAIMGEVKLDLSNIQLGAGTSEIHVRAFMGNVEITVPHNLRIECDGTPFLGEFTVKRRSKSTPSPDAPLIRITGGSFMASVEVKVIDPQAPSALDRVRAWVAGT
jgi:cell wall-active antibiotic response 4TMS protein YvqF